MTTANLGRIGFVPQGTWAAGSYKNLDVVRYNGATYVCKATTTTPPSDTSSWQLIASDGVQGAQGPTGSSGGVATVTKTYNFIGPLSAIPGTIRWYPERTISLTGVYLTIGSPAGYNVTVDIKKNNVSILSGSYITMSPNTYKTTIRSLSQSITSSDYITADVISATNGSNLSIIFIYS
jgi:hypothetical protein